MTLEELKKELADTERAIFYANMSDSYAETLEELSYLEPRKKALEEAIKKLEA